MPTTCIEGEVFDHTSQCKNKNTPFDALVTTDNTCWAIDYTCCGATVVGGDFWCEATIAALIREDVSHYTDGDGEHRVALAPTDDIAVHNKVDLFESVCKGGEGTGKP